MTIEAKREGNKLFLKVAGRVDNSTASQFEKEIQDRLDEDVTEVLMDFSMLYYISSAGLRVLLMAQKTMNKRDGKMVIRNANSVVRETFHITGFLKVLTVE
ncbi:MAG: STAS domain-containing protein [Lachnospiraceae bacterium]|nr:STAS domain-containing protein [Lachnospiraceae bacterium]